MIISEAILKQRPGLTVEKADAVFSGKFSRWIEGEPVPPGYQSRLRCIFGKVVDVEETSEPRVIKEEQPLKTSKRKRRG